MKQTLKTLIRNVKSINGNSLAEFATVTALMATLAATAAPKLSEMSEGAKAQKSTDELDKLVKQAGQFYQDTADIEGRGRFPGQDKYDMKVGGHATESIITAQIVGVEAVTGNNPVAAADPTYTHYMHANGSDWLSVFGIANSDVPKPTEAIMHADDVAGTCQTCPGVSTNNSIHGVGVAKTGHQEWLLLFGDSPLGSTYQDGHFVYQVVAGGGTGNSTYPPTLYVADVENASHFNNVLEP